MALARNAHAIGLLNKESNLFHGSIQNPLNVLNLTKGVGWVGGGGINIAYCTYQNVRKQLHMYFIKTFHELLTQVLLFSAVLLFFSGVKRYKSMLLFTTDKYIERTEGRTQRHEVTKRNLLFIL